jgi:hypothetical protein
LRLAGWRSRAMLGRRRPRPRSTPPPPPATTYRVL